MYLTKLSLILIIGKERGGAGAVQQIGTLSVKQVCFKSNQYLNV